MFELYICMLSNLSSSNLHCSKKLLFQATVRQPVVKNMLKALYFQFTVGVLPMYAVTFIGYWAYGSSTSAYLLNNVNGPVWVKAMANISAFLQTVIALHVIVINLLFYHLKTGEMRFSIHFNSTVYRFHSDICKPDVRVFGHEVRDQRKRVEYQKLVIQNSCQRRVPGHNHTGLSNVAFPWRLHEPYRSSQHIPSYIYPCKSYVSCGKEDQTQFFTAALALD